MKPAMLVVGGYFDAEDCYGAWNLYQAIEKQNPGAKNNLVMGPWFHGQWSKDKGEYLGNVRFGDKTSDFYQHKIELPFFNYYLKGKGSIDSLAEATVFITGDNQWKKFSTWPPVNIEKRDFYLNESHGITLDKASVKGSADTYVSDPSKPVPYIDGVVGDRTKEYMTDDQRFAAQRTDVLVYSTNELDKDLTITGRILADLKVSLSTTDADFVVKIIDVFPSKFEYDSVMKGNGKNYEMGGYQQLVRGEVMRGKFRNSFEKPEPFTPGKVETVRFDLPDIAHTFQKGHRLMVQIQSSWFPLVDRNPQVFTDIYHCDDKDFVKSEVSIHHNSENSSKIVLPVLK
jgi:putative CocE/NonD family hydrolase